MVYRNGTYVAFHADGTNIPGESDMDYYRLLTAWHSNDDIEFSIINSHDKTAAVRDSSKRETLRRRLVERLGKSKNLLLIITKNTKNDDDWVPMEISYAVDNCAIPIIACYPKYEYITAPDKLSNMWPASLKTRIENGSAKVIHIPFKLQPIKSAISQFSHRNMPPCGRTYYTLDAYIKWGIAK